MKKGQRKDQVKLSKSKKSKEIHNDSMNSMFNAMNDNEEIHCGLHLISLMISFLNRICF